MSDSTVALGLVGVGPWGRAYIRTIRQLPDVQLVSIASSNPENAALVDEGCAIERDWRELVQSERIDGLIVATPPASHAEIAIAAVEAGIAVLVEKPLALSVDEAHAILEAARRRRTLVMVDHIHLFHPAFVELCDRVRRGAPVRRVTARAGANGPFRPDTPVLWDWGPHDVAMCLALFDELPTGAAARRMERRESERGVGETVSIDLQFSAGRSVSITVSNLRQAKERRFEVETADATFVFDDYSDSQLVVVDKVSGDARPVAIERTLPLTRVVEAFAGDIRSGSEDRQSLELGVEVVEILTQCQRRLDQAADG